MKEETLYPSQGDHSGIEFRSSDAKFLGYQFKYKNFKFWIVDQRSILFLTLFRIVRACSWLKVDRIFIDFTIVFKSSTENPPLYWLYPGLMQNFQVALVVKKPPANAGDIRHIGLIPGMGRSLGGGNSNPLQCFCPENPMDRGAWRAAVHGVARVGHNWSDLAHTQASCTHSVTPLFRNTKLENFLFLPRSQFKFRIWEERALNSLKFTNSRIPQEKTQRKL